MYEQRRDFTFRRTALILDIECYINYFLVAVRDVADPTKTKKWEMRGNGDMLNIEEMRRFFRNSTIITFNGNNYDIPILTLALDGANCSTLKSASDDIIVGRISPWDFYKTRGVNPPAYLDHVDIFNLPKGGLSLKVYAARIGAAKLQDLPIEPDARLTRTDMDEISKYCDNDTTNTLQLYKHFEKAVGVRVALSNVYGIDLRSKSDAQVAEGLLIRLIERKKGYRISKPDLIPYMRGFKFKPPKELHFITKQMRDVFDVVKACTFRIDPNTKKIDLPPALKDIEIKIGSGSYNLQIGGLHSQEKGQSLVATDDMVIRDIDVGSFYPTIIVTQGLTPKQLGAYFLELFTSFKSDRLSLKHFKVDDINPMWNALIEKDDIKGSIGLLVAILKIFLNGTYGKLGSHYSKIFAPDLMIQVTLTGQLMLLMLIERLESRGISVVSGNTDGIVLYYHKNNEYIVEDTVAAWEAATMMEMESTFYSSIHSRDVNNYIAITTDGEAKQKGDYATRTVDVTGNNQVCIAAIVEYLKNQTPLDETIYACDDILMFANSVQARGGAMKDGEYIGKVIRWYHSTETTTPFYTKKPKKGHTQGSIIGSTQGGRPMMNLLSKIPRDLDYEWYIREAEHMLNLLGVEYSFAAGHTPSGETYMASPPDRKTIHYIDTGLNAALCGLELKDRHSIWEEPYPNGRICKTCGNLNNDIH